jgi:hypothetical protein
VTQETDQEGQENGRAANEPFETLRQAAKAVAAAAAVGAAVGAARAFTSRHSGEEDGDVDEQRDEQEEQREPAEARQARLPDQHEEDEEDEDDGSAAEQAPRQEDRLEDDEEPEPEEAAEAAEESQPAAERQEPAQVDRRDNGSGEDGSKPLEGGSVGETTEIVRRAREQFEALQGREPESISSLERTDGGWTATFEVVEMARIPNSMDVLASYEVALDEDKNMVRLSRARRYYRAQAGREGGP